MREYPTSEMLLCYSNPEKEHYSSLVFIRYSTSFEFQMRLNLRRKEKNTLLYSNNVILYTKKKMQENKEIQNKGKTYKGNSVYDLLRHKGKNSIFG